MNDFNALMVGTKKKAIEKSMTFKEIFIVGLFCRTSRF